jgi:hypothetical protein
VDQWKAAGITPGQIIEPVLRFMEQHEDVDFGLPGPFIHFMEICELRDNFGIDLYEKLLTESLERKPVAYTLWMLHRVEHNKSRRAQGASPCNNAHCSERRFEQSWIA